MDNTGFPYDQSHIGPGQVNTFGDRYFYKINPGTFYKSSASSLFDAHFASSLFHANSLYVVVGTDSGLLPHYVQDKGIPDGTRYMFIEQDIILAELKTAGALDYLDERILCTNETNWVGDLEQLNIQDYLFIDGVHCLEGLGVQSNSVDSDAELSWHVVEHIRQMRYKEFCTLATEPFIIQQIANLADNHLPAILLKDAFVGKTAFVLGGGPSLDEALEWLSAHRQQVVIFAASRVIRRLLQVGLEPDFVVSVDPFHSNFEVSKEMLLLSSKPTLICSYHLYSPLLSQWAGRSFSSGDRTPWNSVFNPENIVLMPPTVTNTAIHVASELGFEQIFLAGVDFCFTADGHTHAQGSIESAVGSLFSLTTLTLETYANTMAPTGADYALAREMLEQQIAELNVHKKGRIFNSSLNAAKVAGIECKALSSIVLDTEPPEVESLVNKQFASFSKPSFFKKLHTELRQALHQLKAIKHLAQEALECNEQMYADGYIKNFKDKKRLDKIEQTLDRKHSQFSNVVKAFGLRNFLYVVKPMDDDNWTLEEVKIRLRVYYQSYVEGAKQLISLLEKALSKLLAREEEEKSNPNWALILQQSRDDQSFGRVKLWQRMDANKPEDVQHLMQEFEHLFIEQLNNEVGPHAASIHKKAELPLLKSCAVSFFKHKGKNDLYHLLQSLDGHHDPVAVVPYRYLIQGYIAELEQDPERAIEAYEQLIELGEGPLEEALVRIVQLDLKKGSGDLAHQALECLAQLNVNYLLLYADSLRIRNQFLEAIDVYNAYLEQFPDDLMAQLKLAQFYLEQKIYEGAEMMLNYILEKNPNQHEALVMKQQLP